MKLTYLQVVGEPQNESSESTIQLQSKRPNRRERRKHLQLNKKELPHLEDKHQFPGLGEPEPVVPKPVPSDYSNIWAKCNLEKKKRQNKSKKQYDSSNNANSKSKYYSRKGFGCEENKTSSNKGNVKKKVKKIKKKLDAPFIKQHDEYQTLPKNKQQRHNKKRAQFAYTRLIHEEEESSLPFDDPSILFLSMTSPDAPRSKWFRNPESGLLEFQPAYKRPASPATSTGSNSSRESDLASDDSGSDDSESWLWCPSPSAWRDDLDLSRFETTYRSPDPSFQEKIMDHRLESYKAIFSDVFDLTDIEESPPSRSSLTDSDSSCIGLGSSVNDLLLLNEDDLPPPRSDPFYTDQFYYSSADCDMNDFDRHMYAGSPLDNAYDTFSPAYLESYTSREHSEFCTGQLVYCLFRPASEDINCSCQEEGELVLQDVPEEMGILEHISSQDAENQQVQTYAGSVNEPIHIEKLRSLLSIANPQKIFIDKANELPFEDNNYMLYFQNEIFTSVFLMSLHKGYVRGLSVTLKSKQLNCQVSMGTITNGHKRLAIQKFESCKKIKHRDKLKTQPVKVSSAPPSQEADRSSNTAEKKPQSSSSQINPTKKVKRSTKKGGGSRCVEKTTHLLPSRRNNSKRTADKHSNKLSSATPKKATHNVNNNNRIKPVSASQPKPQLHVSESKESPGLLKWVLDNSVLRISVNVKQFWSASTPTTSGSNRKDRTGTTSLTKSYSPFSSLFSLGRILYDCVVSVKNKLSWCSWDRQNSHSKHGGGAARAAVRKRQRKLKKC